MTETTTEKTLRRLQIGTTDVFLENLGPGRGKIIIADPYGGNYSYFWGSMGNTIEQFILDMNFSYFHGCVNPLDDGIFDGKLTVRNIRRRIREDFTYELPWYNHLETQKKLRVALRVLEYCENQYHFVDSVHDLVNDFDLSDIEYKVDRYEFIDALKSLFSEPWHYIENSPSQQSRYLEKLFPQIQKTIKKELNKK